MDIQLLIIICILVASFIVLLTLYRELRHECRQLFEMYLNKREEVIRLKRELRNIKETNRQHPKE